MSHPMMPKAVETFRAKYGKDPSGVAFAPGRVNIIGEHTDYNEGFVLPCAVDLATFVAFARRDDNRVRITSDMVGEDAEFALVADEKDRIPFWARYAWGTGMSLLERGINVSGIDAYSVSTVPQGGGLSSSASFEVAMALAYLGDEAKVSKRDLVHIARRAENAYVGVNCGVMDQFSSIFGSEGHAIMLDCRSLEYKSVPFPTGEALVVADTRVRHALGETGYHTRQEECRRAVETLSHLAGIRALRDATLPMLTKHKSALGSVVFRRAHHVVTEDARVLTAASAMESGDVATLGRLMSESHVSLRDDYEVSCRELDVMVECAVGIGGCLGGRMVGGGFGGCTVSLVEADKTGAFAAELAKRYKKATGLDAITHVVRPGRGAGLLEAPAGGAYA